MAITKEIWQSSIVDGLFADNSFLSKSVNDDEYVNQGKKVHIPNAGKASKVEKNRTKVPAEMQVRLDKDIDYDLDEYTTDPVRIPDAENVELSYDKRESVIGEDRAELIENVADDFCYKWCPKDTDGIIKTTGLAESAHLQEATGNRKAICKKDVLNLMTLFNTQNIPQAGRYLMLDAIMYGQLLNDLTEQENNAFLACADAQKGVLGQLYSFNIMMRSKVIRFSADNTPKEWNAEGAPTDCSAALAWHERSVSRALGEVKMFGDEGNPLAYGDIYSFLVRAGGRIRRFDGKGVFALVQDTAEAPAVQTTSDAGNDLAEPAALKATSKATAKKSTAKVEEAPNSGNENSNEESK